MLLSISGSIQSISFHAMTWLTLTLLLPMVYGQSGLVQTYCSSQNTGSSNLKDTTIYETLGNCQTKCGSNYAFAIVQAQNCWCSNVAPGDQQNIDLCDDTCLGYPYENCGSVGGNLFGYLALGKAPTSTMGASSKTSTRSSSSSRSSPTSSTNTDSTVTPDSTTPSTTAKPTIPITSQQVQTIGGSVVTAFVTIIPTAASDGQQQPQKSKLSTGSTIGIAVAVVVVGVLAIIAGVVGCLVMRRRNRDRHAVATGDNPPTRHASVLSRAGLLGGLTRSRTAEPYEQGSSGATSERRNSKPLVIDQRLNPTVLMQHDDTSRSSFWSLQDNRDYNRTLNVRNPDHNPDP